jgi:hypothetical protein
MSASDKADENVRVCVWSHEASRTAGFAEDEQTGSWLTLVGNPARSDLAALDGSELLEQVLRECVEKGAQALDSLSPPFVGIFYDGLRRQVNVVTDRCGLQHVYVMHERDRATWVSSSSLALAASFSTTLDYGGIAEWLGSAHFLGQRTFFHEITKPACGEHLVLGRDQGTVRRRWVPSFEPFVGNADSPFLNTFVESLRACVAQNGLSSELTGGIDSRLVLAGLLSLDVPFFAWTMGNPGSIELRTIERLRQTVPFEHRTIPIPADRLVARLPALVAEKHELGDAEENALEYSPLIMAFEELEGRRLVSLSGVPGELFRGFYFQVLKGRGQRARGIPIDALIRTVTRDSRDLHRVIRPELLPDPELPIRSAVEAFVSSSPASTPEGILEDFYLRVRMQRFAGRGTTTTGLFGRHGLPYFGNDLVAFALALPYEGKRKGVVIANGLAQLSPKLAEIPREWGIPIITPPLLRPDLRLRGQVVLARKGLARYGGRTGQAIARMPPEAIPWSAARSSRRFRDFVGDLLLSSTSRVAGVLEPSRTAGVVEQGLSGGSLFPLGLLLTFALTLERLSNPTRSQKPLSPGH